MSLDDKFKENEKAAEQQQQQTEDEVLQAYRDYLKEIRNQVGLTFEKYAVAGVLAWSVMMAGKKLDKLEKAIADKAAGLNKQSTKTVTDGIKDSFQENFYRTGWAMETGAQVSLSFSVLNPETIKASILNPLDRITWPERMKANTEVMIRQIREEITQGVIQGKAYDQIAKAVTERINMGASKAIRIVQTETGRAQSEGTQAAFDHASEQGLIFKKVWVSTLDIKTRDRHRNLDGQKVDPDKPFHYGSLTAMYPRGWGVPEMDVNCRCTHRAEIEGMEPELRRARNPGTGKNEVIKNMTYEEWYESRVNTDPKALLAEKMYKNRFADTKQHEAYKKILGKDAPSSFEKFQNLKYNDVEAWKELKTFYKQKNAGWIPKQMDLTRWGNNLKGVDWQAVDFAPKTFVDHYDRHSADFGSISKKQYSEMARDLLNSQVGGPLDGFSTNIGYVFRYDRDTNSFAVAKPDGVISTFYKPDKGLAYWEREKNKYGQ